MILYQHAKIPKRIMNVVLDSGTKEDCGRETSWPNMLLVPSEHWVQERTYFLEYDGNFQIVAWKN